MTPAGRKGDLDEIFEILVTSYVEKGRARTAEGDLCWRPATDVYETADQLVVQMELAGLQPAAIEVLCDARTLVVRGQRAEQRQLPGAGLGLHLATRAIRAHRGRITCLSSSDGTTFTARVPIRRTA